MAGTASTALEVVTDAVADAVAAEVAPDGTTVVEETIVVNGTIVLRRAPGTEETTGMYGTARLARAVAEPVAEPVLAAVVEVVEGAALVRRARDGWTGRTGEGNRGGCSAGCSAGRRGGHGRGDSDVVEVLVVVAAVVM
jgi:hypothetical protein